VLGRAHVATSRKSSSVNSLILGQLAQPVSLIEHEKLVITASTKPATRQQPLQLRRRNSDWNTSPKILK
jgi:hypothetical protein